MIDGFYYEDNISAVDACFEAQKIAFAPFSFQATYSMIKLGILEQLYKHGEKGLRREELEEKCNVSSYGISVLIEIGLDLGIFKLNKDDKLIISKMGCFFVDDRLTKVNMDFMQDVCYDGAKFLTESIISGKPEGLRVFGTQWHTVYEALANLPEQSKKSWFSFDHYYSDNIFPEMLEIVFADKPAKLMDIGGNTAKWAILCAKHDLDVNVTIVDLPGQTNVAQKNIDEAGFSNRIKTYPADILKNETILPLGHQAIWMSQFLDCFSLDEITGITRKIASAITEDAKVYVLEPLIDKQRFRASSFCLEQTSLYFTCIANGNSKMYSYKDIVSAIEQGGLKLETAHHNLGIYSYSLLVFKKK